MHSPIEHELSLRNSALDAATSHFMILEAVQAEPRIVYINRACASAHGYEIAELMGKTVAFMRSKTHDEEQLRQLFRGLGEGRPVRAEVEIIRRDGSTFWLGFSATPLCDEAGTIAHAVFIGADITARLEAERKKRELQEQLVAEMRERERIGNELRLAQKLESVGRLAAGLAHEINTPIQYVGDSAHFLKTAFSDLERLIAGYRQAVEGDEEIRELEADCDLEFLTTEVPKALSRTLEGIERVASIIRAMKEFAHPGVNQQGPTDINHALETTLTVARGEYKYAAALSTDLAPLPPVVCNVGELNQVFVNLIVNAAHAISDAGRSSEEGRIRVSTREVGASVEIAIEDNGCGIAPENLDRIFDPFFTTKAVGRGSGQGLAIARSIVVDKHRGDIAVKTELGIGTCFVVRLPIRGAQ